MCLCSFANLVILVYFVMLLDRRGNESSMGCSQLTDTFTLVSTFFPSEVEVL